MTLWYTWETAETSLYTFRILGRLRILIRILKNFISGSLLIFAHHFTSLLYRSIEKNASPLKKSFAIEKLLILNKIFAILSILLHENLCNIEKQTLRYWKNTLLLRKISSLLKQFWYKKNLCYIVNIATWKTIQYRNTNSSLLKKMLRYWKNSLLLKKISLLLKKMLRYWKSCLHYWKKCLRYIVNIVMKLGAYLYSEVCFCPHSRCQILWERCLFLMAYVSLWISGSMIPRSVQSTKLKFQSVANQFY